MYRGLVLSLDDIRPDRLRAARRDRAANRRSPGGQSPRPLGVGQAGRNRSLESRSGPGAGVPRSRVGRADRAGARGLVPHDALRGADRLGPAERCVERPGPQAAGAGRPHGGRTASRRALGGRTGGSPREISSGPSTSFAAWRSAIGGGSSFRGPTIRTSPSISTSGSPASSKRRGRRCRRAQRARIDSRWQGMPTTFCAWTGRSRSGSSGFTRFIRRRDA